jgi:hypothetical protein
MRILAACSLGKEMCAASAKASWRMVVLVHHGNRSAESIEFRKARFFCYKNSKFDPKLQERVFEGSEADMRFFVKAVYSEVCVDNIPECPQGLVLADNRLRGAFQ